MTPWLNLLPLLTGILLGVPLFAREFEEGTYQFALTQSISRRRWALTQIGTPLLIVVLVALIMTALVTWWNAPFDQIESRFGMPSWDFEGLMPLAFGLLAFALSAFAGGVLRRTVPKERFSRCVVR